MDSKSNLPLDNGLEFSIFEFYVTNGILHQTTCVKSHNKFVSRENASISFSSKTVFDSMLFYIMNKISFHFRFTKQNLNVG